jgi:hypothetical protein
MFYLLKNYGQIPLYLQTRKTLNEPMKSQSEDNSMVLLPAEERLCLINSKHFSNFLLQIDCILKI